MIPTNVRKALLGAMLGASLLSACATAPVTGRQQLMLVSESDVVRMGSLAYRQELSQSRLNSNPQQVAQVRRVGQRIAQVANRPDYQWEFNVIDEPQNINAFALPGGKVAVYSGLLNLGLSDDELAAVIGHEVGHAIAQHSRERVSQQVGFDLALSVLAGGRVSPQTVQLINTAFGIGVGLPFERRQESEADLIGLDLMARAGYDPRAALSFWQKMMQATRGAGRPPELLSSHPSDQRRIRTIQAEIPRFMPIYERAKRASR
ncbi:MAG: M48 family metallopeptidase [Pseudomonadota bacterium]